MRNLLNVILCKLFWFLVKSKVYNSRSGALFNFKYYNVLVIFFFFFFQLSLCFYSIYEYMFCTIKIDIWILVSLFIIIALSISTAIHKYMINSLKIKRIIFNQKLMQSKFGLMVFLLFLIFSVGGGGMLGFFILLHIQANPVF